MAVTVIDTIKPKNNGTFPVAEAADIAVTGSQRLPAALNAKANQSDVTALQTAVAGKASQADLTALSETVAGKQNALTTAQITACNSGITSSLVAQISTNTTAIASKASQADLDATNTTVAAKANTSYVEWADSNLQSQIDNIVTPVTQDAEVQNARVGYDSTSYTTLKERLDTERSNVLLPFNKVSNADNNTVINAITDFVFYTKDTKKTIKISQVLKNKNNVYAINITIDGTSYSILNVATSSYAEPSYNKFDLGDTGYGYFVIDWTALTDNTSYNSINSTLKQVFIQDYNDNDPKFKTVLLPFNTVSSATNNTVVKAISDFCIRMKDTSKAVKLVQVLRNKNSVYSVTITIDNVQYSVLNVASDSYNETSYNKFDLGDAGYGYFVINWTALTDNTSYNSINSSLKQIFKEDEVETAKYRNVEVLLPNKINAVVGKEISIEYFNVIKCTNVDELKVSIQVTNSAIQDLGTRLKINPSEAGNTNEQFNVSKNGVSITRKSFKINAVADVKPTIKALFIGDSMTQTGIYLSELVNMLGSDKITLYGTRSNSAIDSEGNARTVYHEGRGGWSASNYNNNASVNEMVNPFYNDGFDFSYYMTNNPTFSDVTDVFVLLGTNDGNSANFESNYSAIISSIKAYNSSIRVHCMLPIPPARDGYAFGTRNYYSYLTFKDYMFNNAKIIKTLYDGQNGYSVVPINVNLDCWYDFPKTEVAVNSRNPQQVTVLNDNVHPSKYGYYRFADVLYADIVANCQ